MGYKSKIDLICKAEAIMLDDPYNFLSNSIDFEHEMRERELRLRGFHRSTLTEEDEEYLPPTSYKKRN